MKIKTNFYTIYPFEDICYITLYASWDDRVMGEYIKHRTEIVSALYSNKNWAILMDVRDWTLHTPDAEEQITRILKKIPSQRPMHYAFILEESELKKWQLGKSLPADLKPNVDFFNALDKGKKWLTSLGYEMTPVQKSAYPKPEDDERLSS